MVDGRIQPAMLNSVMALHSLGYRDDHPLARKGFRRLKILQETVGIFLQPCVSPGTPHGHQSLDRLRLAY
jgi:squalene-hopene/tetraprenyl-beta-curcumene cyclase